MKTKPAQKNKQLTNYILRLINFIDQNPVSKTYGCFDRSFWHYKIEKDFPSAIYQQGVFSLALIYSYKKPDNQFYRKQNLKKLILAGISFWQRIQNQDGSFSEWYPYERSYVATSFTSFAISETTLHLKKEVKDKIKKGILKTLQKSGKYLKNHHDPFVANHLASDLPFFYNLYLLTKKKHYLKTLNDKRQKLLEMQNKEGWFKEYKGADLGYQTLTIYYLAKYYQKTKDKKIEKVLEKALNFTSYFLHPDGSFGGEYNSRNTKYFLPAGFAILSKSFPKAAEILAWWKNYNPNNLPSVSDDRYFCFFFLPNYLETLKFSKKINLKKNKKTFTKHFKNARILIKKTNKYYAVVGYNKNGVIKIFQLKPKPKLIFSDAGYFGKLTNSKVISSQFVNLKSDTKLKLTKEFSQIKLQTKFIFVDTTLARPLKFLFLRSFNCSLGKIGLFSNLLSNFLKKTKILKTRFSQTKLIRTIDMKESKIVITDIIYPKDSFSLFTSLSAGSALFTPSSKITTIPLSTTIFYDLTKEIKKNKALFLARHINLSSPKPKITSSIK